MPAPVRVEVDARPPAQPPHQVIDRRVGQRAAVRLAPQVDEHVVAVQVPVLVVQVVGIQPDQLGADRDRARLAATCVRAPLSLSRGTTAPPARRRPGPHDAGPAPHRSASRSRTAARTATGPAAGRTRPGSPAPRATVSTRGSLRGVFNAIARRGCGSPLLMWCRNGFHAVPRRPAGCQVDQQLAEIDAVAGRVLVERADRRQFPVHRRPAAVMLHRRQHRHLRRPGRPAAAAARRRTRRRPPAAPRASPAPAAQEDEPVLQVMRVRLDRVRRPLDVGQVRQIPLDRLHRDPSSPRTVHDSRRATGDSTR